MLCVILDDIMLDLILPLLHIIELTNFPQTSQKAQMLCSNKTFWTQKFKELPFHYHIPETASKIF